MQKYNDLALQYLAIGSLPHKDVSAAMSLVENNFEVPFWPQLSNFSRIEDMIFQFLEHMPGIVKTEDKIFFDNESDMFFEQLEELFMDYEEILADINSKLLDKYKISPNYSSTFDKFIKIVNNKRSKYAKGQIVGAFTLATSLTDKDGKCAYYDETLREVIVKTLILKALWQVKQIKDAGAVPIIFMDEPSLSQLGTSAFITVENDDILSIFKEITQTIQQNGALVGVHCCGKCEWPIIINSGANILNLDAYFYSQSLSLYENEVVNFLKNGGLIAWGIVPTLDSEALGKINVEELKTKFFDGIDFLVNKGIDRKLILSHSLIAPSCGAGSLSVNLAQKAMGLLKELSEKIRKEVIFD